MKHLHTIALQLTCLLLAGCLSSSNLTKEVAPALKHDEGIAVIGLKSQANALFWLGDFKDGRFKADGFFPKGMRLLSGEPYLVQNATATAPDRRYGFVSMTVGEKTFGFGCGQELPLLTLKPGVAQYFGDFTLSDDGGKLTVRHTFDISSAQAYLDKTYPGAGLKLEEGIVERAKVMECPAGPNTIYIYVPRIR